MTWGVTLEVYILSRTQRLFDLIQILRRHRYPVTGKQLADELDVSLRTLYRDIASGSRQPINTMPVVLSN